MRKAFRFLSISWIVLIIILASCQTKPQTPPQGESSQISSIQAEAAGLAPAGDPRFQTIKFAVVIGAKESAKAWTFAIVNAKGEVERSSKGDATALPDSLSWDGKNNGGALSPEGNYTASLTIDYGSNLKPVTVSSKPFLLDINPPTGSFKLNPLAFTPTASGVKGPITATVEVKPALAKVESWTIEVFDPSGATIRTLSAQWPSNQASWDGKTDAGDTVKTATSYTALLKVRDEFGNTGTFKGEVAVTGVPNPEASTIIAGRNRAGFSPTSTSVKNSLDILLTFGSKASISSWKVEVMSASKGTVKTFSGDGTNLPEFVQWNGKDDAAQLAPEGSYFATLTVDYGGNFARAVVKSRNFSLVTTAPTGSVTVDPPSVYVADVGPKKPINFTVQAKSPFAQIAKWNLSIQAPDGTTVAVFNANWPNNKAAWDGAMLVGSSLAPATLYKAVATVEDEYGNIGTLEGSLNTETLLAATEPTTITARQRGFAPKGDGSFPAIDLDLTMGNAAAVKTWKVDLIGPDGTIRDTLTGTGAKLPVSVVWDGTMPSRALAPEGYYTAQLSVDYGNAYAPATAKSAAFLLDITPPSGSIELSSKIFSPDGTPEGEKVTITMNAGSSFAKIVGWDLSILDPELGLFASMKGVWPKNTVVWDGTGANGELVESASDYSVVAKIRDEFGNIGSLSTKLVTDILAIKTARGYRIRVPSIVFKPYTSDYRDVPPDRAARNITTLDLLAGTLKVFPYYKIRLEGHAVMINWDDRIKGQAEQSEVLIPLSVDRAEAIKAALVERGVVGSRFAAQGLGANDPVVPDSDLLNRWKNRRVEFFLEK
ncbi:MAG TPA: OmpA family protein [Rectinemataceae bacterium]|nr:OmpA family protein [Rectinemataceae bacterium]